MSDKTQKTLTIGGVGVTFAFERERADRLRKSFFYRSILGPGIRRVRGLRNGEGSTNGGEGQATSPAPGSPVSPEGQAILDRISGIEWYHTIELPHGVATPGFVDHRPQLDLYGLPEDMRGMRALDVATYDGFWAFEMERRGAEVTAIDIGSWAEFDIPRSLRAEADRGGAAAKITGEGFRTAHELTHSRVQRMILNVYDLSPQLVGSFDFVFLSDLLLHLRDPQRALENICSVLMVPGTAVIAEVYNPRLEDITDMTVTEFAAFGEYVWWRPSTATLKAMMRLAGFDTVEEQARFCLQARSDEPIHKVVLKGSVNRRASGGEGHAADA